MDAGRSTYITDDWPTSPLFQDFATFMGLLPVRDGKGVYWPYTQRVAKKLEEIYAWGKAKSKSNDPVDIKLAVKQLIRNVGTNEIGESKVNKLWNYVKFSTLAGQTKGEDRKEAIKEMQLVTDNNSSERSVTVSKPAIKKEPGLQTLLKTKKDIEGQVAKTIQNQQKAAQEAVAKFEEMVEKISKERVEKETSEQHAGSV